MFKNVKDKLFYIGLFVMAVAWLLEHTFFGESNIICFFKGFATGLLIVGGVVLVIKNRNKAVLN